GAQRRRLGRAMAPARRCPLGRSMPEPRRCPLGRSMPEPRRTPWAAAAEPQRRQRRYFGPHPNPLPACGERESWITTWEIPADAFAMPRGAPVSGGGVGGFEAGGPGAGGGLGAV